MRFRVSGGQLAATSLFASMVLVTPAANAVAPLEVNYAVDFSGWVTCYGAVTTGGLQNYGSGCYQAEGDKVIVTDLEADGQRVAVHWHLRDGSRRGLCVNKDGNGERRWCNKDFPESQDIQLRVGRCDGDLSDCEDIGDYNNWSAWGPWTSV